MKSDKGSKSQTRVEEMQDIFSHDQPNIYFRDLVKLSSEDLDISKSSIKTYISALKNYQTKQREYFGIEDYFSSKSYLKLIEMEGEKRIKLGFTGSMMSIVKKYIKKAKYRNGGGIKFSRNTDNLIQNYGTAAAQKQRDAISSSAKNRYIFKFKDSTQFFKSFKEDYINVNLELREATRDKGIIDFSRYFGAVDKLESKEEIENASNYCESSKNLADIINCRNTERVIQFMVLRNKSVTKTTVDIVETISLTFSSNTEWLKLYANPLTCNQKQVREAAHRAARRGFLDELEKEYYETGEKSFALRKATLSDAGSSIFELLTPEEANIYIDLAKDSYFDDVLSHAKKVLKKCEAEVKKNGMTRNPFLPIAPLLELYDPSLPISIALIKNIRELLDLKKSPPDLKVARLLRDCIFVSLVSLWPLRRSHWLKMKYAEDRSGHMYFSETGNLVIQIPIEDFKNGDSESFVKMKYAGEPVSFTIKYSDQKDLLDLFKLYVKDYLHLLGIENGSLFYNNKSTLDDNCRKWQKRYLHPVCDELGIARPLSFGVHSFRHICATTILRVDKSPQLAADLLLDTLTSVLKFYSAYLPSEGCQDAIQNNINRRKALEGSSK